MDYKITFKTGTVRIGSPTGRFVKDPDGWWREIWTPTLHLDDAGRIVRAEPTDMAIRTSIPFDMQGEIPIPKARTGWFWRLLGMERAEVTEISR